ncbi:MAG: sigma-70 family RNA polymerase sigma factor, partial [Prevotellaceae bacterium]|nr:sigma-70 family RNA polymerase sigma factor [Candidatus Faecinaster equi]
MKTKSVFTTTNQQSGNSIVAQVMNPQCEKIVRTIARQFTNNPDDQQDLMQEGYIGLVEAAKRYDPNTGVQFDSYASWWVRKYVREYMLNNSQIVRLSVKTKDYLRPITEDIETPLYAEEGDVIRYADILT